MIQEQKIYFFWLAIETKMKSSLWEFCEKNDFLYVSSPKDNKTLVGVFEENYRDKSLKLIENFIGINELKNEKCTIRKNSAQVRKYVKGGLILELDQLNQELRFLKQNKKAFPEYIIDDLYELPFIQKIEAEYRYRLNEDDWEKIEKNIMGYISSYPCLSELFQ